MNTKMKQIEEKLNKLNKTISTMESCTGGGLANLITNIEGASNILNFSAVTYSNEFKIKMGVNKDTIDKYTVYSKETAREMAYKISLYSNSNYGVGVTGKLMCQDNNNKNGDNNQIYYCIYNKDKDKYYDYKLKVYKKNRELNKQDVLKDITDKLFTIINKEQLN